jgi:threonine dehydratase
VEVVGQAEARGVELGCVTAPIGGGGLIGGIATAVKALSPKTAVVGVEPEGFDDVLRSLQRGERVAIKPSGRSLCDAIETTCCGEITFPIMQKTVADVAVVTDAEVAEAMRYAFNTLKLVVEPGGCVGLAALLAGKLNTFGGSTVGLVLSGGNVDADLFARVLKGEL